MAPARVGLLIIILICALSTGPGGVFAGAPPAKAAAIVADPAATAVRCVSLPGTKNEGPRNLWIARTKTLIPSAVLVLYPNKEQDVKALLASPLWQNFAEDSHLGLAAVTLAAAAPAGKAPRPTSNASPAALVLQAIDHEFNNSLPLVLYAWPQQADFAAGLLAENSRRVLGWCLRSPGHLPVPPGDAAPPGIVVCQKENKPLYDTLMGEFAAGRKKGGRLTWVALPGEKSPDNVPTLDAFVRDYFTSALNYKPGAERWTNLDNRQLMTNLDAAAQPALASFLPHPALTAAWAALHTPGGPAVAQQTIIEHEEDTRNPSQPKLQFYLRRPVGTGDIKGVLAYCTWEHGRAAIIARLRDEKYFLVRYADAHHLALITWSTAIAFSNGESADERSQQDNFRDDLGFDKLADAWERGVHVLCYQAGLPERDFLLYGLSAGAQWAHRLALRKPGHFLAVNIHVNSSYDWPTPAAKNVLWLQTTGEREYGYPAALRFYARARELGYPIIFKAGENLGHASSPQIEEIARRFFDYAQEVKARRDDWIAHADHAPGRKAEPPTLYALAGFDEAPYYADLINQEVYTSDQKDMIPTAQRVPVPTRALASAWGEIIEEHGPSLVSNPPAKPSTAGAPAAPPAPGDKPGPAAVLGPVAAASPLPSPPPPGDKVARVSPARPPGGATPGPSPVPAEGSAPVPPPDQGRVAAGMVGPLWSAQMERIARDYISSGPGFRRSFQKSINRVAMVSPALARGEPAPLAVFLAEYDRLKRAHSPLLLDPTWPEQVARTLRDPPASGPAQTPAR